MIRRGTVAVTIITALLLTGCAEPGAADVSSPTPKKTAWSLATPPAECVAELKSVTDLSAAAAEADNKVSMLMSRLSPSTPASEIQEAADAARVAADADNDLAAGLRAAAQLTVAGFSQAALQAGRDLSAAVDKLRIFSASLAAYAADPNQTTADRLNDTANDLADAPQTVSESVMSVKEMQDEMGTTACLP